MSSNTAWILCMSMPSSMLPYTSRRPKTPSGPKSQPAAAPHTLAMSERASGIARWKSMRSSGLPGLPPPSELCSVEWS